MSKHVYLLVLICAAICNANGQAGRLDSTFGNKGIQTTALLNKSILPYDEAKVVLTTANGDIFVVARYTNNPWYTRIVKYLPDGKLDSSYGNRGFSYTANLNVTSAVLQGEKIVIAGSIYTSNGNDFALARYTANGALDVSFGVNGFVQTDFNNFSDDNANAIVLQGNRILAGGYSYDNFNANTDFALAGYTADGKLDSSFAENGLMRTDFNDQSNDRATTIALQGDKILLAGSTLSFASMNYYDFALARYTSNGRLDSSFGSNGTVATDFNHDADQVNAMVMQGDQIILAGYTNNSAVSFFDFALVRYTADGVLDASFGQGGKVVTDLNNGYDNAYAIALQGDQLLVAGSSDGAIGIARYLANGELDGSFGTNGKVLTDFENTQDDVYSIALQGDRFILGGSVSYFLINGFPSDFALARYAADGALDVSFGTNGKLLGNFPVTRTFFTTTATQGNQLVAAGYAFTGQSNDFALARYSADGMPDPGFGKDGIVTTDFNNGDDQVTTLAVQGDKLIAGGYTTDIFGAYSFVLVRYTAGGVMDSSFGKNGIVTTNFTNSFDHSNSILLQGDKILVSGSVFNPNNFSSDFALVRYTANGSLDSSFGQNSQSTTDFNNANDRAGAMALQGDKIILCGSSENFGATDFALTRYTKDGEPDASFGQNGIVTTDFNNAYDFAKLIAVQGDQLIVGGSSGDPFAGFGLVLARYTADGVLDAAFGQDGKLITDFRGSTGANSMVVQGDQLIVGGQNGSTNFSLNRYTTSGSLDSSFGQNGQLITPLPGIVSLGSIALHQNRLYAAGSLTLGQDESYGVITAYQLQTPALLSCPADKIMTAEAGNCTAVVKGIDPVLSAGASPALANYTLNGATIGSGQGSACGTRFNLGTTLVTYSLAADPKQTCSFQVTVVPAKEQCNGKDDNCDGQVDEGCPCSPFLKVYDAIVNESEGNASVTVTLSKKVNQPVVVFYQTADGTAKSNQCRHWPFADFSIDQQPDYIARAGILTIPAGAQSAVIQVPVINDGVTERSEYFYVRLRYAFKATITDHQAIVTIRDGAPIAGRAIKKNELAKELLITQLGIKAYPNPSPTSFIIQIQSGDHRQLISLQVYDISGRLIEQKQGVNAGQLIRLGDRYLTGTYIVEAVQGKERVRVEVIKADQ